MRRGGGAGWHRKLFQKKKIQTFSKYYLRFGSSSSKLVWKWRGSFISRIKRKLRQLKTWVISSNEMTLQTIITAVMLWRSSDLIVSLMPRLTVSCVPWWEFELETVKIWDTMQEQPLGPRPSGSPLLHTLANENWEENNKDCQKNMSCAILITSANTF